MNVLPNETVDPIEQATIQLAAIYHDTGYMTEPSQVFLDEGHPRWSQQNFDENVRPMVEEALGKDAARNISNYIRTHDATDIDWESDPMGSAIRVSDNTALFAKDKLPPMCRDVPGNLTALEDLATGKSTVDETKDRMRANIDATNLPPDRAARYYTAVDEVTDYTPKATLGMLGGEVQKVEWAGDHVKIDLKESPDNTRLNRIGDFGQRQFAKLAETYGADPKQFQNDLSFNFKSSSGKTLLEGAIVKATSSYDRLSMHLQSLTSRLIDRKVASISQSDGTSAPRSASRYKTYRVVDGWESMDRKARRELVNNRFGYSKEPHMHPQPVEEHIEQPSHGIVANIPDVNQRPIAPQKAVGRYERLAALSNIADGDKRKRKNR
jgi:hypothetical protein